MLETLSDEEVTFEEFSQSKIRELGIGRRRTSRMKRGRAREPTTLLLCLHKRAREKETTRQEQPSCQLIGAAGRGPLHKTFVRPALFQFPRLQNEQLHRCSGRQTDDRENSLETVSGTELEPGTGVG